MVKKEGEFPDEPRYEPTGPARKTLIRRRILEGLPLDGSRVRAKDLFALGPKPTISRHLNEMRKRDIVLREADFDEDGRPGVFYRFNRDGLLPYPPEVLSVKGHLAALKSQEEPADRHSFEKRLRLLLGLFLSDVFIALLSCQEAATERETLNRVEVVADVLLRRELLALARLMWYGRDYSEEILGRALSPIYEAMAPLLDQP